MSYPKKGNSFPTRGQDGAHSPLEAFAMALATALRSEYGTGGSAMKTVARLTGADKRAVKNWFAARHVPRGDHLIVLIRQSDQVLAAVLALAGRERLLVGLQVQVARTELARLLHMLDGEGG